MQPPLSGSDSKLTSRPGGQNLPFYPREPISWILLLLHPVLGT